MTMTKKTQKSENQEEIKDQKMEEAAQEQEETQKEASQEEEEVAKAADEEGTEEEKAPDPEEKLAELQDRYLRLSAEYDNYRKRTLKEKLDLMSSSREEVIVDILPLIDDFERAMGSIESAKDLKAVQAGLKLIYGKFRSFLNQQGVQEIEATNKPFDTDLHEAVTKIPVEEKKKKGKVVDVIEKGYTLKDKVIRFSKVVIGE
jgi:molecular chaperone GrpE